MIGQIFIEIFILNCKEENCNEEKTHWNKIFSKHLLKNILDLK